MKELLERYPALSVCSCSIEKAVDILEKCYRDGGKIMLCGNGGSAADCEHIVGELMKGFLLKRTPENTEFSLLQGGIPAISLPSQCAVLSAFANDVSAELVYAQLVYAYGKQSDAVIGLSTSGNSKNVVAALKTAKKLALATITLTGANKGLLDEYSDVCIKVPETETYKIQEYHLPVYHYICAELERRIFA